MQMGRGAQWPIGNGEHDAAIHAGVCNVVSNGHELPISMASMCDRDGELSGGESG
jgi:hypothetical protein